MGDLGDTTSSRAITSCLQLAAMGRHGQGAVWRRDLWRKPLCVGEGRAHHAQVRIHLQEVLCQVLGWATGGGGYLPVLWPLPLCSVCPGDENPVGSA